ncbi:MAG: RNA polymerase sigma factor [Pirellulales bacterium]
MRNVGTSVIAWSAWIGSPIPSKGTKSVRCCNCWPETRIDAEAQMEFGERRDWVRQAVEALPETLRTALVLVYYQGLKYREAADVLEIPVGTVKSRLHAAILKLHEAWNQSHSAEHD